MSNGQKRDATCLATESDGDLMGNQLPTTSQSIDLKREGTVCVIGKDWVLIKKRRLLLQIAAKRRKHLQLQKHKTIY